jgi:hypothetical protein
LERQGETPGKIIDEAISATVAEMRAKCHWWTEDRIRESMQGYLQNLARENQQRPQDPDELTNDLRVRMSDEEEATLHYYLFRLTMRKIAGINETRQATDETVTAMQGTADESQVHQWIGQYLAYQRTNRIYTYHDLLHDQRLNARRREQGSVTQQAVMPSVTKP